MRSSIVHSLVLTLALVSTSVGFASSARAQATSSESAAAEVLFREGRRLLDAGHAAEACPKLEESMHLDPGQGTQFFLGQCFEALGRTASAWAAYREVESAAKTSGRKDREDLARRRAEALEPKLVRLQIDVPWAARVPNVEVRRNDVLVGPGQRGIPLPIDPGATVVHVAAPRKVAIDIRLDLKEEGKTRVVTVPELADAPAQRAAVDEPQEEGSFPDAFPLRTMGWVVTGAGAAGVLTSGILGLVAKSKFDSSKSSCNANNDCSDASDVAGRKSAVSTANVATVVFVGSLVVVAAGVVMILVAPKNASATTARLSYDGASLGGRF